MRMTLMARWLLVGLIVLWAGGRAMAEIPRASPEDFFDPGTPTSSPSTSIPSRQPTREPSRAPSTSKPSAQPSKTPTTSRPSKTPTNKPTKYPTSRPTASPTHVPRPPNVLLLMVDDFKPILNSFDSPFLPPGSTPNMDNIVRNGVSFMNAHAQFSLCGPSRSSFLTSQRPDLLQIYSLTANSLNKRIQKSQKQKQEILTLPKLFKLAGYNTYGVGKVFHENEYVLMQSPDTWTVPVFTWLKNMKRPPSFSSPYQGSWIASPDVADNFFTDGQAANLAAGLITDVLSPAYIDNNIPWFLAVGLWKPHLPWYAPKKYFDQCGDASNFNAAFNTKVTTGLTPAAWKVAKGSGCHEASAYGGPQSLAFPGTSQAELQVANQAYHSTILYSDVQIGTIMNALASSESAYNTIVILLGDHGFHLGDKGLYCKHTNFEQGTHVPFVVSLPPTFDPAVFPRNRRSYAPVELLDIVPTLVDLTALTMPAGNYQPFQGLSLRPILVDPSNGFVKSAAVSQYPRAIGSKRTMGYTVRTTRYRYTVWGNYFQELYDYLNDPWETMSLTNSNAALKQQLASTAYRGKSFNKGNGQQPFDFGDRQNMLNRPPLSNA